MVSDTFENCRVCRKNTDFRYGLLMTTNYITGIKHNTDKVKERIDKACRKAGRNSNVKLVAVTKTHPVEVVQAVIDAGISDIGENRVQEMEKKVPALAGNFTMHMIGHLQTNKVAKALEYAKWIQSIDSIRLADKIDAVLRSSGARIKALVEVNTSGEASKSGCSPDECKDICSHIASLGTIELKGLMTVGPLSTDEKTVRLAFALLRGKGEECRSFMNGLELSMGMSSDFEWAVEEGATIVRIGTLLFGNRQYARNVVTSL
jgi:PLP dependent protein